MGLADSGDLKDLGVNDIVYYKYTSLASCDVKSTLWLLFRDNRKISDSRRFTATVLQ
jgi:hypothetical protein